MMKTDDFALLFLSVMLSTILVCKPEFQESVSVDEMIKPDMTMICESSED